MYQVDCSNSIGRQERRVLLNRFRVEGYTRERAIRKLSEYTSQFEDEERKDIAANQIKVYEREIEKQERYTVLGLTRTSILVPPQLPIFNSLSYDPANPDYVEQDTQPGAFGIRSLSLKDLASQSAANTRMLNVKVQ